MSGPDSVLQTPQKGGQGQHGEIPAAYPAVAARSGTPQLCRGGGGGPGRTGRPAHGGGHEGHIVAAQEAPPSSVLLRNGHGRSPTAPVLSSGANGLGEHWTATLEPLDSRATDENGDAMITDGVASANQPKATSARKPTFLQRERWKAIQKARRQGISLRSNRAGIHRSTTRKYLDAEGTPTRQSRAGPTASSSDTIQA